MAICVTTGLGNVLVADSTPLDQCSTYILLDASQYRAGVTADDLRLIGVDAETIATVYCWGFAAVVAVWFLGYVIRVAIDAIHKM